MANKPYIIMTCGYTACFKTTIARKIAGVLRAPLIEMFRLGDDTHADGANVDDNKRARRFSIMNELVDFYFKNNLPVVIDSSFNARKWREPVYKVIERYGVTDIVWVVCYCDNIEVIKERLKYRGANPDMPDSKNQSLEIYLRSKREHNPVSEDRLPGGLEASIIMFNSELHQVTLTKKVTPLAGTVFDILSKSAATGTLNIY